MHLGVHTPQPPCPGTSYVLEAGTIPGCPQVSPSVLSVFPEHRSPIACLVASSQLLGVGGSAQHLPWEVLYPGKLPLPSKHLKDIFFIFL